MLVVFSFVLFLGGRDEGLRMRMAAMAGTAGHSRGMFVVIRMLGVIRVARMFGTMARTLGIMLCPFTILVMVIHGWQLLQIFAVDLVGHAHHEPARGLF